MSQQLKGTSGIYFERIGKQFHCECEHCRPFGYYGSRIRLEIEYRQRFPCKGYIKQGKNTAESRYQTRGTYFLSHWKRRNVKSL